VKRITLTKIKHRGADQLAISFRYDLEISQHLKQLEEVCWSQTHKVFYLPYNSENKKLVYNHLWNKKGWYLDYSAIKKPKSSKLEPEPQGISLPTLSQTDATQVLGYRKWMQQKRLSQNTVNTYAEVTVLYFRYVALKNLDIFSSKSIERFNYDFIVRGKKSISYQNQCINGIK